VITRECGRSSRVSFEAKHCRGRVNEKEPGMMTYGHEGDEAAEEPSRGDGEAINSGECSGDDRSNGSTCLGDS